MSNLAERVRERLAAVKMKPTPASEAAGLGKDFIRDILRGKKLSIGLDAADALARVLKTTPDWLSENEGNGEAETEFMPSPDAPGEIRYGGIVEAGTFRKVNSLNQDAEYQTIPLAPNPRYPVQAQYAFLVEGDSMNLEHIVPGMWVHAVDLEIWERFNGERKDGQLVIVEVSRNNDSERELTVKKLRIFRDRIELQACSSNPANESYVIPHAEHDEFADKYRVRAIVLATTWLYGVNAP